MSCKSMGEIETLECTWNMLLNNYINKAAAEKVEKTFPSPTGSTHIWGKLIAQVETIFREEQNLKGYFNRYNNQTNKELVKIDNLKKRYNNRKLTLSEKIDLGLANSPRKVDTLDKKSRAYLTTSFYTVSLFTMSFFIYKQLKVNQ